MPDYYRPVSGGRITQRFGDPAPPGVSYTRGFKNGMSFAAPAGTPVMAAGSGRVVRVTSGGDYGTRIEIEHEGGGTYTLYAHLSAANVRQGQTVQGGQVIGAVGSSGQTTGAHLHFEVRRGSNSYWSAVDPQPFLNMNATPGAYIRDVNLSETITAAYEGDLVAEPMPTEGDFQMRPLVYTDPLARFLREPEVLDSDFGALIPQHDETDFSMDVTEGAGDTEVQMTDEPSTEPEPVEMI